MNQLATLAQKESSALDIFNFEGNQIRTSSVNGEPWFAANDVCQILQINNSRQALSRLDDDEKGVISSDTLGGAQQMGAVNESGLYALTFTSRKPEARRFKKWVTSVLLPGIRKKEFVHVSQMQVSGDVLAKISASYESLKQDMEELKRAFLTSQPQAQLAPAAVRTPTQMSRAEIRQRGLMAPTQLAKRLGVSTPRLHAILEVIGLQSRVANRYYVTSQARGLHEVIGRVVTKAGKSVDKFLWNESVIEAIPKQYL